jgi:protein-L-isoaspartate(D-aspartate) O-methyltransferase
MTPSNNILRQIVLSEQLIQSMKQRGTLHSPLVEAAFRAVSRHLFLPGETAEIAYADAIIPLKEHRGMLISSASAPSVIASLLEQLDVEPGHKVLEIGAGTGYTAGLLAHLVSASGEVITVDIDRDITDKAAQNLLAAGLDNVKVVLADGAGGYSLSAPYDRILLTVGSSAIAAAWVEQLAPAGRLVMPLWVRGAQFTAAFERAGDGLISRSIQQHPFVRLQGKFAGGESMVQSRGRDGLAFSTEQRDSRQIKALDSLLQSVGVEQPLGLTLDHDEAKTGLTPWLATHEPHHLLISADPSAAALVPGLFLDGRLQITSGVWNRGSLALLGLENLAHTSELFVKKIGRNAPIAVIRELVTHWDRCNRPTLASLEISAIPLSGKGEVGETSSKSFELQFRWLSR